MNDRQQKFLNCISRAKRAETNEEIVDQMEKRTIKILRYGIIRANNKQRRQSQRRQAFINYIKRVKPLTETCTGWKKELLMKQRAQSPVGI